MNQGLWLALALLLVLGGPTLGCVAAALVLHRLTAPWRARMAARRLDALAQEIDEIQKHRKIWPERYPSGQI